jgi:cytoplasmic iron level regulating protein YaaA (DUF328/UPF0246 family)
MLVLLPPSEGKTAPASGEPADLDRLVFAAALGEQRGKVLEALDPGLRDAPAAPAAEVYSGVLFKQLELPKLPAKARRQVLIASALWGMVRPDDRIPNYKLPPKEKLEGIGPLAKFWRPALTEALPDKEGELIVDMRSTSYSTMWKPKRRRCCRSAPSPRAAGSAKRSRIWPRQCEGMLRGCCCGRRKPSLTPRSPPRLPNQPASPSS